MGRKLGSIGRLLVLFGWLLTSMLGCAQDGIHAESNRNSPATLTASAEIKSTYQVGKLLSGSQATHTFEFKNTTGERLALDPASDVSKSCGCASYDIDKESLQPAEIARITLAVNTATKSGDFSERVVVNWNTESNESVRCVFGIAGEVVSAFRCHPKTVFFSRQDIRNQCVRRVRVESDLPIDWSTVSCSSTHPAVVCTGLPGAEADMFRMIDVSIDQASTHGPVYADIELAGTCLKPDAKSGASQYTGEIAVSAENASPLRVSPNIVHIRRQGETCVYKGVFMITGALDQSMPHPTLSVGNGTPVTLDGFTRLGATVVQVKFSVSIDQNSPGAESRRFPLKVALPGLSEDVLLLFPPRSSQ